MINSEKVITSLQKQDLERADKYLQKALLEDDSEILLELASYLESIGFLPQAKLIYLQEKERHLEVCINLAQIAAEDGDMEEAFAFLDQIDSDSEDYVSALLVMADLYDMEGLSEVAREKLLLASQISDEPLVIFGLAEIELKLGHYQQAIQLYAQLDNREFLEQLSISTYQRIGRCYAAMGKFEAAIEFLEKTVEIAYEDSAIFELGTLLYEQKEFQKANLYFKQLDTLNPDFLGYEYVYALSLHEEHKIEEALRLVQQGLSKNEFDTQLLLLASQLSYELHDSKQAEYYLLKAKDVALDDEDLLMRLTNLYLEQGRYEEVLALDKDGIDTVLTRWNIAQAYHEIEDDEQALQRYEQLFEDLKNNPEFLQTYTYLLRELGYSERAYDIAKRYLTFVPDDLEMTNFLEDY